MARTAFPFQSGDGGRLMTISPVMADRRAGINRRLSHVLQARRRADRDLRPCRDGTAAVAGAEAAAAPVAEAEGLAGGAHFAAAGAGFCPALASLLEFAAPRR